MKEQRLKELLDYDPLTGIFIWKINNRKASIGKIAGYINKRHKYIYIGIDGMAYRAHRLAWFYMHGKWPNDQIDHINGNRSDNRIDNLRDVNGSVNQHNINKSRIDNKIGLKGVGIEKHGGFNSRIQIGKKRIYLGKFNTPEEAHKTYLNAKKEYLEGVQL